jgi:hypothetical protein
MGKFKKVEAGALNIKIHPHSTKRYVEYFEEIYSVGNHVKIWDKYYGTIGWLRAIDEEKPENGIEGEIYKYLNIDPTKQWFDKKENKTIKVDKKDNPPPIPDSLKPHLQEVYFLFFPQKHRLIFEANNLSHNSALKLFEGLLNNPTITKKFGISDIHIESSKETIEKILQLSRLAILEIHIALPNPDDNGMSDEEKILARMDDEGARTVFERKTAFKGKSLTPDDKTKLMMKVATSNGKVYAVGYDEGEKRVVESTENHPLKEKDYYDPDKINIYNAFKLLAKKMLGKIAS